MNLPPPKFRGYALTGYLKCVPLGPLLWLIYCAFCPSRVRKKGSLGKGVFFRKVHLLEILENLEILEILENPQIVENKGESDHFLEILENLEIVEILEISPVKRPLSERPPFSGPDPRAWCRGLIRA